MTLVVMKRRAAPLFVPAFLAFSVALSACDAEVHNVGGDPNPSHREFPPGTDIHITRAFTIDAAEAGELCVDRPLPLYETELNCSLLSARFVGEDYSCDEPGRERAFLGLNVAWPLLEGAGLCGGDTGVDCNDYCVCTVLNAAEESLSACVGDAEPPAGTTGWCYVSPSQGLGSAELVEGCEDAHAIRLFGDALPKPIESLYMLVCSAFETVDFEAPHTGGKFGDPCLPSLEGSVDFTGGYLEDIAIEFQAPSCEAGFCFSHHFQGRVSCPYGQTQAEVESEPACFVPWSNAPVTVPVSPQLVDRRSDDAAVCSCRCDGPDANGRYCTCPLGMKCAGLTDGWFSDFPSPTTGLEGSFCIPLGTDYDPTDPPSDEVCDKERMNCGDARPF